MGSRYTLDESGNTLKTGRVSLPMTDGGVTVPSAVSYPIQYCESMLLTVAISGAVVIPSYTIYLLRKDNIVYLSMPPWNDTAVAALGAFIISGSIPQRFRTIEYMSYVAIGTATSQDSQLITVRTNGQIEFWRGAAGNAFVPGQPCGFKGQGIYYRGF